MLDISDYTPKGVIRLHFRSRCTYNDTKKDKIVIITVMFHILLGKDGAFSKTVNVIKGLLMVDWFTFSKQII